MFEQWSNNNNGFDELLCYGCLFQIFQVKMREENSLDLLGVV